MKCKRLSLRAYVQLPQPVSDELLYVLIATVVQGDARALSVRPWCGGLDPMGARAADRKNAWPAGIVLLLATDFRRMPMVRRGKRLTPDPMSTLPPNKT